MGPYSMDLRKRVWAALQQGTSSLGVAQQFGLSDSCVRKWRLRMLRRGNLKPGRPGGRHREFDHRYDRALARQVAATPDATGQELAALLGKRLGRVFSKPVLCRALKRLGLTRKKRSSTPVSKRGKMSRKPAAGGAANDSVRSRIACFSSTKVASTCR
jgi:transposase